jgi:hypothetical protein
MFEHVRTFSNICHLFEKMFEHSNKMFEHLMMFEKIFEHLLFLHQINIPAYNY